MSRALQLGQLTPTPHRPRRPPQPTSSPHACADKGGKYQQAASSVARGFGPQAYYFGNHTDGPGNSSGIVFAIDFEPRRYDAQGNLQARQMVAARTPLPPPCRSSRTPPLREGGVG